MKKENLLKSINLAINWLKGWVVRAGQKLLLHLAFCSYLIRKILILSGKSQGTVCNRRNLLERLQRSESCALLSPSKLQQLPSRPIDGGRATYNPCCISQNSVLFLFLRYWILSVVLTLLPPLDFTGTSYGKGVYFARDASYSMNYSRDGRSKGDYCCMYLSRVLVGEYCKGTPSMIVPPPKRPSQPEILFDSAVDNTKNPTIFVVFSDNQCYPEYLITFT